MATGLRDMPFWWADDVTVDPPALSASARYESLVVPVSFETGFQTTLKLYQPYGATVLGFRVFVTKALSGTDAGTITLQNAAGTQMTGNAVATLPASSALGFEVNNSLAITAVNTIAAGSHFKIVVAKTTVGGEALVVVELAKA